MTDAAQSLLLTLNRSLWLDASHSARCSTQEIAMRELLGLRLVKYHSPMNAWFITEAGKREAQKIINAQPQEKEGTKCTHTPR